MVKTKHIHIFLRQSFHFPLLPQSPLGARPKAQCLNTPVAGTVSAAPTLSSGTAASIGTSAVVRALQAQAGQGKESYAKHAPAKCRGIPDYLLWSDFGQLHKCRRSSLQEFAGKARAAPAAPAAEGSPGPRHLLLPPPPSPRGAGGAPSRGQLGRASTLLYLRLSRTRAGGIPRQFPPRSQRCPWVYSNRFSTDLSHPPSSPSLAPQPLLALTARPAGSLQPAVTQKRFMARRREETPARCPARCAAPHPRAGHNPARPPKGDPPRLRRSRPPRVVRSRAQLGLRLSCSAETEEIGINPPINV